MTRKVVKFIILILEVQPYNWLLFSWSDDVEVTVEMVNAFLFLFRIHPLRQVVRGAVFIL